MTEVELLTAVGDAETDGEGLAMPFEFGLAPGSLVQPTARAERLMINPRAVFLVLLILWYLIPDLNSREHYLNITLGPFALPYFVLVGIALAAGEGDGVGLGLGLVVAGAVVSPAGEEDGDDAAGEDAGLGEFESGAGSQAAASAIARIIVNSKAVRLIDFVNGLLISFASFEQD